MFNQREKCLIKFWRRFQGVLCRVVRKLFTKFQENKLGIYVEGGFFEEVVELLKEFYWKKYLLPPRISAT